MSAHKAGSAHMYAIPTEKKTNSNVLRRGYAR